MMPIKKRVLLIGAFYTLNVGFSFLCLWIGTKGLLSTLRFEWMRLMQLGALFSVFSFAEMCVVMHRYHRKNNAFGTECIALDFQNIKLVIAFVLFYVTSFVVSFWGSITWISIYMCMFVAIIVGLVLLFGSGRFLWIDGEKRNIVNELGEVYPMKTLAVSGEYCVLGYLNYRKMECRIKVKQNKRMKEFLGKRV